MVSAQHSSPRGRFRPPNEVINSTSKFIRAYRATMDKERDASAGNIWSCSLETTTSRNSKNKLGFCFGFNITEDGNGVYSVGFKWKDLCGWLFFIGHLHGTGCGRNICCPACCGVIPKQRFLKCLAGR
jgi:hypothetical protein